MNHSTENGMPSEEEKEEFLAQLEQMRQLDPEAFKKTLELIANTADTSIDRQSLLDSISKLNSGEENLKDVLLPGGKATLGSEGIKPKMKGIDITPDPGFVIKTKNLSSNDKVFINLCTHEEIAPPAMKKRLDEEGNEVEGMNIPLSVGPPRLGSDKNDKSCTIYDIIVNAQVVEDIKEDISGKHRDFICQLCIQSVEQKYKMSLDNKYKLPKLKYMGAIVSQHIQDRKNMPKIEEVKRPAKVPSSALPKTVVSTVENLNYEVSYVGTDGIVHPDNIELSSYIEPLQVLNNVDSIQVTTIFSIKDDFTMNQLQLGISTFRVQVCVPNYKVLTIHLPCAVLPHSSTSTLRRREGYARMLELIICLPIDAADWSTSPDVGSKPWLIAEALREDSRNHISKVHNDSDADGYAEDKFHIPLPSDVDPYTGVKVDADDLPEDRFHKLDAHSSYLINQREQAVKDKWTKYEKEKAERKNDPNVEYIDLDDYKPGQKYGAPKEVSEGATIPSIDREDLKSAAHIVAASLKSDTNDEMSTPTLNLSSNLWTELLD